MALRADFEALQRMLDNFSAQLAAGKAISRAQAESADRFFKAFHAFFEHHHYNEEGELGRSPSVTPPPGMQPVLLEHPAGNGKDGESSGAGRPPRRLPPRHSHPGPDPVQSLQCPTSRRDASCPTRSPPDIRSLRQAALPATAPACWRSLSPTAQ